uniref:Uncharacterized protein n=1 Tax=Cacopsylla melanoneura TaxID=428564 RepID=A0A8D8LNT9_9HEMI
MSYLTVVISLSLSILFSFLPSSFDFPFSSFLPLLPLFSPSLPNLFSLSSPSFLSLSLSLPPFSLSLSPLPFSPFSNKEKLLPDPSIGDAVLAEFPAPPRTDEVAAARPAEFPPGGATAAGVVEFPFSLCLCSCLCFFL